MTAVVCGGVVGLAVEVVLLATLIIAVVEGKVHIARPLRQRRKTDR